MRNLATPIVSMRQLKRVISAAGRSEVIRNYFNDSYKSAVSALAEDQKISVDELREIIRLVESRRDSATEERNQL